MESNRALDIYAKTIPVRLRFRENVTETIGLFTDTIAKSRQGAEYYKLGKKHKQCNQFLP